MKRILVEFLLFGYFCYWRVGPGRQSLLFDSNSDDRRGVEVVVVFFLVDVMLFFEWI